MPAVFRISKSWEFFNYLLIGENQEVLMSGNLYSSEAACRKEIRDVIRSAGSSFQFEKTEVGQGQHSFILRNRKGRIVGQGASYWAMSSRDFAIIRLRREMNGASIEPLPRKRFFSI